MGRKQLEAKSKQTMFIIDEEMYSHLIRKAANESLKAGKMISISSIVRDLIREDMKKQEA